MDATSRSGFEIIPTDRTVNQRTDFIGVETGLFEQFLYRQNTLLTGRFAGFPDTALFNTSEGFKPSFR
jgi:hypothetical protein